MSRIRSSIPYDILHGIHFPSNKSSMFAYLSYFPPPPPVLPGPPPTRSWTCSSRTSSSPSCLISDDRNPPSLRSYPPLIVSNQTGLLPNTSHLSTIPAIHRNSSTLTDSISDFFRNQFQLILFFIIFLSIFTFVIFLLLFFVYLQRLRQRSTSSSLSTNNYRPANNTSESPVSNSNRKNKKFYHTLIPYRRKHSKRLTTATTPLTNTNDDENFCRVSNHDSPVLEVIRLSQATGTHFNDDDEQQEETL